MIETFLQFDSFLFFFAKQDAAPTDDGKRRDEPPPPTPPTGAVVSDADAESSDAGDVWEPSQRRGGVEKGVAAAPAPAKTGRSAAAKEKSKGRPFDFFYRVSFY